ncbi:MAG TPA: ribosome maturation factor RimM [Nitrosomonas sp.]|nr:ribosome maturation factor RimM [Nitrosomonas sp.]HQX12863.1 ribosome maturation factor RimM [Nitrosomonas sp.]HRB33698.1 ribosome maturation factor RimM [Nitrosomonas sp.]HRB46637.1 ribosome maturation factor RimM [Nitrosomonas sp.]HRB77543.1 ribosome maturation factor RimM [Nitrosomonas sp.]
MGHVLGPFGIRGWIRVQPYTEQIDGLLQYSSWWLGAEETAEWRKVILEAGQINGNHLNIKLAELSNREQAAQLKGLQVAVPRDYFPVLPSEQGYYWSDLIGKDVINLKSDYLGKVTGLFETGANDVLRVQNDSVKEFKEILIPFIKQAIIKVDLETKKIIVDWESDY